MNHLTLLAEGSKIGNPAVNIGIFVGSSIGYMFGSFIGGRFLDSGRGHQVWAICMSIAVVAIVVISQMRQLAPLVATFVLLGLVSLFSLPISQYPGIVPPKIQVTTTFVGAIY